MEWNPKRCINFPDFSWRRSHGYLVTCTPRVRKIKRSTVDASNIVADRRRCLARQIVVMIKRCTFDRPKFHDRSKLIFLRRGTTTRGVEKPVYRSTLRLFSSPRTFPCSFFTTWYRFYDVARVVTITAVQRLSLIRLFKRIWTLFKWFPRTDR